MRILAALLALVIGASLVEAAETQPAEDARSAQAGSLRPGKLFGSEEGKQVLAALGKDDLDGFRTIIAKKPKASKWVDDDGSTLVHYAASLGAIRCLTWMSTRESGFSGQLNTTNRKENTPLFVSVEAGQKGTAQLLFSAGGNPNFLNAKKESSVSAAINSGNADILKLFLNLAATRELIDQLSPDVINTLIRGRHWEMVKLLVENGADVERKRSSWHPLQVAVLGQSSETVKILLAHKAPVDVVSDIRRTPIQLAVALGNTEITALLVKAGAKTGPSPELPMSALSIAVANAQRAQVEQLISLGVPVAKQAGEEAGPLAVALLSGNRSAVEALLSAGAVLDPKEPNIPLLLATAVRLDAVAVLRSVKTQGRDINQPLVSGWNAMDLAQIFGSRACFAFLSKEGVQPGPSAPLVVSAGELSKRLRVTYAESPLDVRPDLEQFPELTVTVELLVDPQGNALLPLVTETTDERLRFATSDAASRWKFEPPESKGRSVAVQVQVPIRFPSSKERGYLPGELDVPPRCLTRVAPEYPPEFRRQGLEGSVEMEFVIDEKGSVSRFRTIAASEVPFIKAAIDSIRKWTWQPGLKDGQPVPSRVTQKISFKFSER